MIVDDINGGKLPRQQPTRWGDLRPGDTLICPHDGLAEGVLSSEPVPGNQPREQGRQRILVGSDDIAGRVEQHSHVRPSSDVVAVP